jgi:aldose 1-epimerase
MALHGQEFTITAGEHEATVVEVGAALCRYTHHGDDVTVPFGADELPPKACGATLVPWPNRIRGGRYRFDDVDYQLPISEPATGNAIHGLGRWMRWQRADTEGATSSSSVSLVADIVPQTGWPFEVLVEMSFALHADDGLAVTARATNHGRIAAPFGAGFHPYLSTRGHPVSDATLQLPAAQRLITDQVQIPVRPEAVTGTPYDLRDGRRLGELRLDDAFTDLVVAGGRGTAQVRTPSGGALLWFDETFRYVQAFTPAEVAEGRHGIAVEPMTCPADAFNSGAGLIVLQPGESWHGSWGIHPL